VEPLRRTFRGVGAFTVSSDLRFDYGRTIAHVNLVNLPIGAVTAVTLLVFYHPKRSNAGKLASGWMAKLDQFDIPGPSVSLAMIICLLLVLQWGGNAYPWSNGRIIALLVIFGMLNFVFVAIQIWRQDNGTMPPRIMKQRTVGASFGFSLSI
jgi:hypothetical protein